MGVWLARLIVGVLLAAIGLGTPPPGTELEAGGGPGAYHYGGGCDSAENFLHFTALQLRARHLAENGFVLAAETSGQRGVVDRTTGGPEQIGRVDTLFAAALRAGYEGRYGGAEIGPGLYRAPNDFGTVQNHWLPSVKLWLGRYGIAHAWASLLADRTLPTNRLFGFGVGHASERAKVTLGLAGSAGNDATVILDADVGVTSGLWLGMGGQFTDNSNTWGVLARVGFFWDGAPAPPAALSPDPPRAPPPAEEAAPAAETGAVQPVIETEEPR